MQLLFTISVAILLTGSEAITTCAKLPNLATGDDKTCGTNNNEQCPYGPYSERKLFCTVKDDLSTAMFFDTNGCDVLRGHVLCSSSAGSSATNNGNCVPYTHDGRNCPQDRTHAIPLCGELDEIAGLSDLQKASKQMWDGTAWVANPNYGKSGNTNPAQGLVGYHFCQQTIKCYHPQAYTVASTNVGTANAFNNKRLPTPAESDGVTDRCDDYAGSAGTEDDSTADDKGNWRDHIFEAADPQNVNHGLVANVCEKDWWNDQTKTLARSCTPAEVTAGKTVCSDPNPQYSAACMIHQLPSSNSYSSKAQCAHGRVPVDNCNGITFYFFIANRGHNYKFNFCRHSDTTTPEVATTDGTGAHFDSTTAANNGQWGKAAKNNQNQWKTR